MYIFVKAFNKRTYIVEMDENNTIGELRLAIFDKYSIPQSLQILVYTEKLLTNDQATLSDWCIFSDTVMIMLNLSRIKYFHKIIFENNDKKRTDSYVEFNQFN